VEGTDFNKDSSLLHRVINYGLKMFYDSGAVSQHFAFFVAYKGPNKLECVLLLAFPA
jgi:hypothetical protein